MGRVITNVYFVRMTLNDWYIIYKRIENRRIWIRDFSRPFPLLRNVTAFRLLPGLKCVSFLTGEPANLWQSVIIPTKSFAICAMGRICTCKYLCAMCFHSAYVTYNCLLTTLEDVCPMFYCYTLISEIIVHPSNKSCSHIVDCGRTLLYSRPFKCWQ